MNDKFICRKCHRLISKQNKKRHKKRCGISAQVLITSIHKGRTNPRFRIKREYDINTNLREIINE